VGKWASELVVRCGDPTHPALKGTPPRRGIY
jgi:hypothetical protein